MKDGFLRVAAHTPALRVGDCSYNARQIVETVENAPADTALHVFPELCITGRTCGDLFLQTALLRGAEDALCYVIDKTAAVEGVIVVGLPVAVGSVVYNCAAVCCRGELLGLVPKLALSADESRWFSGGQAAEEWLTFAKHPTYLCSQTVFACESMPAFRLGIEIGGLWAAVPHSTSLATAGATVIADLSAAYELVGKREHLHALATVQSARLHCAYVLANAGTGESSADYVFAGGNLIAENGTLLCESPLYTNTSAVTEIDLEHLLHDRRRTGFHGEDHPEVLFDIPVKTLSLTRKIEAMNFVPADAALRSSRCEEVLSIQAAALARRLSHIGSHAVVGLSGG